MKHHANGGKRPKMITKELIAGALGQYHRKVISSEDFPLHKRAAILIALVPKDNELSLLLTVRTDEVETHKGQISCPGGMMDETDTDLTQTALRETEEELGIPRENFEILGMSDDQATPTKFIMTPVVGYLQEYPEMHISRNEVAEVFDVPLSVFLEKKHASTKKREFQGKLYDVWYFNYGKHLIWGATAMILVNFAEIISGAQQNKNRE
jgi:8-oxo-dGTP pyrophosphatase MutT (NUDIX family)